MEEMSEIRGGIKISQIKNSNQYTNVISNLICCICLNIVRKPLECVVCQSLICEDCFEMLVIAGKKCCTPKCSGNLRKANKFVREILSNLKMNCEFCLNSEFTYPDYITHIEKCALYQSNERVRLLKMIREKDQKIQELTKEIETEKKSKLSSKPKKDVYASLSGETLRNALVTSNLPVNSKMELYNACIEGRINDFKKLVLEKNYPVLEEVSAKGYFWTTFHYAMHYGQWEIIQFICDYLKSHDKFEAAMRVESNDKRCPLLCLLRSNSLNAEKKSEILSKFLKHYPNVQINTPELKKEIKVRSLTNLVKSYIKNYTD